MYKVTNLTHHRIPGIPEPKETRYQSEYPNNAGLLEYQKIISIEPTACEVKIILASRCETTGKEIWTVSARYWRPIHGEVMTHRMFSRNGSSSRAIPVMKFIKQVLNNPAGPIYWGSSQPKMQAGAEITGWRRAIAPWWWRSASLFAVAHSWFGAKVLGLHKQVVNRLTEPFQFMTLVITATEWDNFFELRAHPDAQPELQEVAYALRALMDEHRAAGKVQVLKVGEWHLPFVRSDEMSLLLQTKVKLSTARAARASYMNHDGTSPVVEKDVALHDNLVVSKPIHASPSEHQARAMADAEVASGNLKGWAQYRKYLEFGIPVE